MEQERVMEKRICGYERLLMGGGGRTEEVFKKYP